MSVNKVNKTTGDLSLLAGANNTTNTTGVAELSALANIGTAAGATQHAINQAIDGIVSDLKTTSITIPDTNASQIWNGFITTSATEINVFIPGMFDSTITTVTVNGLVSIRGADGIDRYASINGTAIQAVLFNDYLKITDVKVYPNGIAIIIKGKLDNAFNNCVNNNPVSVQITEGTVTFS